jgi:hypothetical protein
MDSSRSRAREWAVFWTAEKLIPGTYSGCGRVCTICFFILFLYLHSNVGTQLHLETLTPHQGCPTIIFMTYLQTMPIIVSCAVEGMNRLRQLEH